MRQPVQRAVLRTACEVPKQQLHPATIFSRSRSFSQSIPASSNPVATFHALSIQQRHQHQPQCLSLRHSARLRYRDPVPSASARPCRSRSASKRTFATSTRHRQHAVLNPRIDEQGNEMSIEITPRAANRLSQIMQKDNNPSLALRVTVEAGGCHGFQYLMSLVDMSKVSQDEDTVFEGEGGARVVMDEPSLELLKGSKVDYTMELIGSQFKIVDNPYATSSCGCGTSFDIKS